MGQQLLHIGTFLLTFILSGITLIAQDTTLFYRDLQTGASLHDQRDSSLTIQQQINLEIRKQQGRGYLLWSVDSIHKSDTTHIYFTPGTLFTWGQVELKSARSRKNEQTVRAKGAVSKESFAQFLNSELSYYENHGYPFARLNPTELSTADGQLNLNLEVVPGNLILVDSLIVKSEDKINRNFLATHLGIHKGDLYDESKIRKISTRLNETPFLSMIKPSQIQFTSEGAKVYVYVKRKKANSFNGILGVQQNDNDDNISITGDLDLKLNNVLNQGERIGLAWRRIQSATQQLDVDALYPYLLNSKIGIGGALEIFRRDSTFSSLNLSGSLAYRFQTQKYLEAYVKRESTGSALQDSELSLATTRTVTYGLSGHFEELDYRFNPRKGISLTLLAGAGVKSFDERLANNELEPQQTDQWEFQGRFNTYIPLFKRFTIMIAGNGATKQADKIFENEMFRLGGMSTMRGMDESSLQVSSYAIGTLEFRYLLEQNSFVHLFFDQGWWESRTPTKFVTDSPMGFGAGVSFETRSGIFALTYAMGQQFDNPVLIRNAKIHFGFTSFF